MNVGRVKNVRWKGLKGSQRFTLEESKIYVGRVKHLRWKSQTFTLEGKQINDHNDDDGQCLRSNIIKPITPIMMKSVSDLTLHHQPHNSENAEKCLR